MVDTDLAALYGVTTKALNQAVKRNLDRFPEDFMFQATWEESENLKSQSVTLNANELSSGALSRSQNVTLKRGTNVKYAHFVFTERGVAMLSSVLNSERAIQVNIQIIRTFSKLREMIAENDHLRRKLEALERRYDNQFKVVFDAIRRLLTEEEKPRPEIGFKANRK